MVLNGEQKKKKNSSEEMMRTELYEKHTVRFSIKDTLLVLWKKKRQKEDLYHGKESTGQSRVQVRFRCCNGNRVQGRKLEWRCEEHHTTQNVRDVYCALITQ